MGIAESCIHFEILTLHHADPRRVAEGHGRKSKRGQKTSPREFGAQGSGFSEVPTLRPESVHGQEEERWAGEAVPLIHQYIYIYIICVYAPRAYSKCLCVRRSCVYGTHCLFVQALVYVSKST